NGPERTERPGEREEGEADHDARDRDRDVAERVERLGAEDLRADRRIGDDRAEHQLEDDDDDRNREASDERSVEARLGEQLAVPLQGEGPGPAQDGRREAEGEDRCQRTEDEEAEQEPDEDGPKSSLERRPSEGPLRHGTRSEEHTSELQSRVDLVCRLLLE